MSLPKLFAGFNSLAKILTRTRKHGQTSKPTSDKTKCKNFLEEDSKWANLNDEEVISLISSGSEEEFPIVPIKTVNGRLYPLLFLAIAIVTNLFPIALNCHNDIQSLECIRFSSQKLSPIYAMIYQMGNLSCSLLSVLIYCNIYNLQKASTSSSASNVFGQWYLMNFLLGTVGAVLWIYYVSLGTKHSYGKSLLQEIILNLYLIISLIYNLCNQIIIKNRIRIGAENQDWKKILMFFVKNMYYFIMMAIVVVYFALEVSMQIMTEQDPQNTGLQLISEYAGIIRITSIILVQFYISLYYVDFNYLLEGPSANGLKSLDKKLDLSRLCYTKYILAVFGLKEFMIYLMAFDKRR